MRITRQTGLKFFRSLNHKDSNAKAKEKYKGCVLTQPVKKYRSHAVIYTVRIVTTGSIYLAHVFNFRELRIFSGKEHRGKKLLKKYLLD